MRRWLPIGCFVLGLLACPSSNPPAPDVTDAGRAEDASDDAGIDSGVVVDAGAADGGTDAGPTPVTYETVTAVGLQEFLHGNPALEQPELRAIPPPSVTYELGETWASPTVRTLDAGLFEFDVPADAGYFITASLLMAGGWEAQWQTYSTARWIDLADRKIGRVDAGVFFDLGNRRIVVDAGNQLLGNTILMSSPNAPADLWVYNCQYTTTPLACRGTISLSYPRRYPIIDPARGDATYVWQYDQIGGSIYNKELHHGGRVTTAWFGATDASYVEVEFQAPDAAYPFTMDAPAFADAGFVSLIHPNAQAGAFNCQGYLAPWNVAQRVGYRQGNFDFFARQLPANAPADTRRYPMITLPAAEGWNAAAECWFSYRVPLSLGGRTTEWSPTAGGVYALDLQSTVSARPTVLPVLDLRVDGSLARGLGLSAQSAKPELAWTSNPKGTTADLFWVSVWEPVAAQDGGLDVQGRFGTITRESKLRVPAGVLQSGHDYFFLVQSEASNEPWPETRPFVVPRDYQYADALSDIWRVP